MFKYIYFTVALLCFFLVEAQSLSEPNDCVNSITICSNSSFSNEVSAGFGNMQEIISCGGFEHNSLWLKIPISQSGTLSFDIIPNSNDINIDYDFWVFGPNKSCGDLGSPIRCATTNPRDANLPNNFTGLSLFTNNISVGPGAQGDGYARWLDVTQGEFYYLAIDGPYSTTSGFFTLNWTGTAIVGGCLDLGLPLINDFKVNFYPNPFKESFVIDTKSLNNEMVKIKVYDTIGRLVEQMETTPEMFSSLRLGKNYTSGIYNIAIFQGEKVSTARLIKE